LLNDVMITVKLIEANAVIGMVPKDTENDGTIDTQVATRSEFPAALCHTITDKSDMPGGGSIGHRIDGSGDSMNYGVVAISVRSKGKFFWTA